MDNNNYILSICIPTYNRVENLECTINSIVNDPIFDSGEVEIVVSDNFSSDNTETLMCEFIKKYNYIKYIRNNQNIGGDRNFVKVLSAASGLFIKLHNDYCEFSNSGLSSLLEAIKKNIKQRPFLFFSICNNPQIEEIHYSNLDEFVNKEYIRLSWISSIGFWKDDFTQLEEKERMLSLKFMQTDWLLRVAEKKAEIIRYRGDFFHRSSIAQKHGDFDYIGVFLNYPLLFDPYVKKGLIGAKTQRQTDFMLLKNLSEWIYRLKIKKESQYSYSSSHSFSQLDSYFSKYCMWRMWFYFYVVLFYLKDQVKRFVP